MSRHEHSKSEISFDMSDDDAELVGKILNRGMEMAKLVGVHIDHLTAVMDITSVHCNGCPLYLFKFLTSSNDDFSHDFTGIGQHVDRKTGQIRGGFKPRCAK